MIIKALANPERSNGNRNSESAAASDRYGAFIGQLAQAWHAEIPISLISRFRRPWATLHGPSRSIPATTRVWRLIA